MGTACGTQMELCGRLSTPPSHCGGGDNAVLDAPLRPGVPSSLRNCFDECLHNSTSLLVADRGFHTESALE
jgi:hypothetical protein